MAQPALQRQKTFLEDPVQPPSKKPRLEPDMQTPAERDVQTPAERDVQTPAERDAAPPAQDAASHGSLSQETMVMGAASDVEPDGDFA